MISLSAVEQTYLPHFDFVPNLPTERVLRGADYFCGLGGTTSGMKKGSDRSGHTLILTVVNHWSRALITHQANHPDDVHLCTGVDYVHPEQLGKLDVFWASPECTHHSVARGGKPLDNQSRSGAMCGIKVMRHCSPDVMWYENVCEFDGWGDTRQKLRRGRRVWTYTYKVGKKEKETEVTELPPFIQQGKGEHGGQWKKRIARFGYTPALTADPKKRGRLVAMWKRKHMKGGYVCSKRVLRACDFGAPTSRKRLFFQYNRIASGMLPFWPNATHVTIDKEDLIRMGKRPLRVARDFLDFENKGTSIFNRDKVGKKNLKEKTIRRVFIGFFKHGWNPALIESAHGNESPSDDVRRSHSVDDPVGAIPGSNRFGLALPYFLKLYGTGTAAGTDKPYPSITAQGQHLALCQPYVSILKGQSIGRKTSEPIPTLTGMKNLYLAQPWMTLVSHGDTVGSNPESRSKSIDDQIPAITGAHRGEWGVCNPSFVVPIDNGSSVDGTSGGDQPVSTIIGHDKRHAVAMPWLIKYYGTALSKSVDDAIDTITGKDRFGMAIATLFRADDITLAEPFEMDGESYMMVNYQGHRYMALYYDGVIYLLDITFRMLTNRELALGQGFDPSYILTGTGGEITKQIGNAVPPQFARALFLAWITQNSEIPPIEDDDLALIA